MATAELATQEKDAGIDPATMVAVIVNGDLSRLTPPQKLAWYRARCDAAGLDPRTQPFQYLQLQGRLTLYATKSATDQLISIHKLTVEIPDRQHLPDLGIYEVRCRVQFPDGRHVEDLAAIVIAGLKGDALCNAIMKCVTKAKRRTVLSACGLGMLDETEVETIQGAAPMPPDAHHAKNHDNGTGHGSGAYASPEVVKAFTEWVANECERANSMWLDHLTDKSGEIRKGPAEICSTFQLSGHILKWARSEGLVQAPEEIRAGSRDKYAAVAWERHRTDVEAETKEYMRKCWRDARAKTKADAVAPPNAPLDDDLPDDVTDDLAGSDEWKEGRE